MRFAAGHRAAAPVANLRKGTIWSREFLVRRIDRCYLIAAITKVPEKRAIHLALARHYRRLLGGFTPSCA